MMKKIKNLLRAAACAAAVAVATSQPVVAQTITPLVDSSGAFTSAQGTATTGLTLWGGIALAAVGLSWISIARRKK